MRTTVVAFALLALATPLSAQAPPSMHDLDFMSGCWEGSFGDGGTIEEHYTTPSDNLMLGTTRYLVDGRAVQFELTSIRVDAEGTVFLLPRPGGTPSAHEFRLTETAMEGGPMAVFEAPANDFPKRIVYRRAEGTRLELIARIDNGPESEQAQEWRMTAASCGASSG